MSGPPDGPPPGEGGPGGGMRPHGPNTEQELKKLTQLLTLTADQQTQVRAILSDRNQQIEALFKSQMGDPSADGGPPQMPSRESMQAMHKQMKSIREAANTQIASLLTADQKKKFESWAKKSIRSSQSDEDMPPPPDGEGGPPPDGGGGPGGGSGGGPGGGGPPGV